MAMFRITLLVRDTADNQVVLDWSFQGRLEDIHREVQVMSHLQLALAGLLEAQPDGPIPRGDDSIPF
jgi:hypothetical protein